MAPAERNTKVCRMPSIAARPAQPALESAGVAACATLWCMEQSYSASEPSRAELDQWPGVVMVEFGAPWCGFCQAAQPAIETVLRERPDVRHLKVYDGRGKPLGRTFRVKLWPTLILLRDGREVARVVRPSDREAVARLWADSPER